MPALLYHTPLNCSLAVRIAAAEGGVDLDIDYVDFGTKVLSSGGSFLDVNPLGQVSTMRLETGELLTETSACLLWVQSQAGTPLRISPSDPAYFQMVRWLGFTATELHKQILRVVFYPEATDAVKDNFRALVPDRFAVLDQQLSKQAYLLGEHFSAADAYLIWFFVLAERAKVMLPGYPHLDAYRTRVMVRPKVAETVDQDYALRNKTNEII